jgi:hypothetical protein
MQQRADNDIKTQDMPQQNAAACGAAGKYIDLQVILTRKEINCKRSGGIDIFASIHPMKAGMQDHPLFSYIRPLHKPLPVGIPQFPLMP